MSYRLGFEAVLLHNTATDNTAYASPTWTENDTVKDMALNLEGDEVDVSMRRGKGWKATARGLRDAPIEIVMVKERGNTLQAAFRDAFFNPRRTLDLLILDGPLQVAAGQVASEGLRAHFEVLSYTENQNLADGQLITVSIKPGYHVAGQEPRDFTGTVAS